MLPSIGKNIRAARKQNNFTTQELAMLVGVSERTIVSIECGQRGTTIENYSKMADILGITIDELIGRTSRREAMGLGAPAGKKQAILQNICNKLTDEQTELVLNFVNNLRTYTKELELAVREQSKNHESEND